MLKSIGCKINRKLAEIDSRKARIIVIIIYIIFLGLFIYTKSIEGIFVVIIGFVLIQYFTKVDQLKDEKLKLQKEILEKVSGIVEFRSEEAGKHIVRVAEYSKKLAELAKFEEKEIELIYLSAPMHDLGKIAIPDNILNKPGKHTPSEWEIMKTHAQKGADIFEGMSNELIDVIKLVASQHHECYYFDNQNIELSEEEKVTRRKTANIDTKIDKLKKEIEEIENNSQIEDKEVLLKKKNETLNRQSLRPYIPQNKSGYPLGIIKDQISKYGLVVSIADVFDALCTNRVYKEKWEDEEIIEYFTAEKGYKFAPELMDLFLENFSDFVNIRNNNKDKN